MLDILNSPIVKILLIALAGANAAVIAYPATPPTLKVVCTLLAAIFPVLGVGTGVAANRSLQRTRAELTELRLNTKGA